MIADVKSFGVITATVEANAVLADVDVGRIVVIRPEEPIYDGEYTVIPTTSDVILPTAEKMMEGDVTVKAIPYFDVSNEYGRTIYIAGNVE